jgi:hypothetical protein
MATENNKGIKYPNKSTIRQQIVKLTNVNEKNIIKLSVEKFLAAVKIKHI